MTKIVLLPLLIAAIAAPAAAGSPARRVRSHRVHGAHPAAAPAVADPGVSDPVVFARAGPRRANACLTEGGNFTHGELSTCLRLAPFSAAKRDQILETITRAVPFYAFTDLSLAVRDPELPVAVDIHARLAALKDATFESDDEMQDAFTSVFFGLRDAHTYYYKGAPYNRCAFKLPIRFSSDVVASQACVEFLCFFFFFFLHVSQFFFSLFLHILCSLPPNSPAAALRRGR
jgi:hypothetical protein